MDFQDNKNLYKVRQTILEMIADRGYNIPESENITIEEFIIKYNNRNIDININDKFYVYFHNDTKSFSKKDLLSIMNKHIDNNNINIIILLRDKENSAITKELSKEMYKNVEIFLKKNMIFNPTKHVMVPKHIILTKEEEVELLLRYNTTKGKLPKMSKMDPIAKYYGMKNDQICKIIRKSPEVGETSYYRLIR